MYRKLFFEISGICQARCPHCCTGNKSLRAHPSRFIPVEEFSASVNRLLSLGLIGKDTQCELYNWGEPFLHPRLNDILQVLVDASLRYRLSTNAAKYVSLPEHLTGHMNQLTISIPGFSQRSYDRVHGFDFQKIVDNILNFNDDLGSSKIRITYLLHQFNIDEIYQAYRFFRKQKIRMTCTVAYMADYNLSRDYLTGVLDTARLRQVGKDLLLYYIDDLLRRRPENYRCPQFSILALDEFSNILTCCAVPKGHPDYSMGSLFSLSAEEIRHEKEQRAVCRECQHLGIDYWNQTAPLIDFWGYLTGEKFRSADILELLMRKIGTLLRIKK